MLASLATGPSGPPDRPALSHRLYAPAQIDRPVDHAVLSNWPRHTDAESFHHLLGQALLHHLAMYCCRDILSECSLRHRWYPLGSPLLSSVPSVLNSPSLQVVPQRSGQIHTLSFVSSLILCLLFYHKHVRFQWLLPRKKEPAIRHFCRPQTLLPTSSAPLLLHLTSQKPGGRDNHLLFRLLQRPVLPEHDHTADGIPMADDPAIAWELYLRGSSSVIGIKSAPSHWPKASSYPP